jgi:hypothetical protein
MIRHGGVLVCSGLQRLETEMFKAMMVAATAITSLVANPVVAHADEADFIEDMAHAGFFNHYGASAELQTGRAVCEELASGWSINHAADDLYQVSRISERSDALQVVYIAMHDLCPYVTPIGG